MRNRGSLELDHDLTAPPEAVISCLRSSAAALSARMAQEAHGSFALCLILGWMNKRLRETEASRPMSSAADGNRPLNDG